MKEEKKIISSNPGTEETFCAVHGLHSFAGQSFEALNDCVTTVCIWLSEENNDSLRIDILSDDIYSGKILATQLLPPSKKGKCTIDFTEPVYLELGKKYFIRVSSGAPGTKSGAVAKGRSNTHGQGYRHTTGVADSMALELVFESWEGDPPQKEEPMHLPEGYEEKVNQALRANQDIWGEALMQSKEGPTYENIKDYLNPLMLCGTFLTDSGVHYVAFGRPQSKGGGGPVGLHVADGSQVISHYYNKEKMTIYVGRQAKERYGSALSRLQQPELAEGYLPILHTSYTDADQRCYHQESFTDLVPSLNKPASFIKITVSNPTDTHADVVIRFSFSEQDLKSEGHVVKKQERIHSVYGAGAQVSDKQANYRVQLAPGAEKSVLAVRFLDPCEADAFVPDEALFTKARNDMIEYWHCMLSKGATFDVPEPRVMRAMKHLLLQNLYMGWRYSIGNAYETFYSPESSDMATTIGMYGYEDRQKQILHELIDMMKPNRAYANWEWGEKLSHAAQYYQMTGDGSLVMDNLEKYEHMINRITEQIEKNELDLLDKQEFSGDIAEPSYYLHQQAVVWRGLHDMADVFGAIGKEQLQHTCRMYADRLKKALSDAVEQSKIDMDDGTVFIPSELLSKKTTVFDPITETKHGSYWNLCIGYALASGFFDSNKTMLKGVYEYLKKHGAWLLGMVRFNYYPVDIGTCKQDGLAGYKTPGVDNVYGLPHVQLMSDMDDADRLVLALYGKLAHGMTRGTYVSGEGDTVGVCKGEYYRSIYLPPSGANNSLFLKSLRLMLIRETTDTQCKLSGLDLAFATPRAWLTHGKTLRVKDAPTPFGNVSYTMTSHLQDHVVKAVVEVPSKKPMSTFRMRLRTPNKRSIKTVTVNGIDHDAFDKKTETVDLSSCQGKLDIRVEYEKE